MCLSVLECPGSLRRIMGILTGELLRIPLQISATASSVSRTTVSRGLWEEGITMTSVQGCNPMRTFLRVSLIKHNGPYFWRAMHRIALQVCRVALHFPFGEK